jgi:pimeloyl-ACP methyl ester carboxylesterase
MHLPALLLCAALAAGPPAPDTRPGVVFVVGGIGGMDPLNLWAPLTLPLAGVPHELRNFPWTHGKCRPLRDLQDPRHIQEKGGELAAAVRAVKAADPGRPVYLVGHSAGAAVALAAAGQLPPGTLERVVLLAAAVSPDYDLRPALRATRGPVVSFSSAWDWLLLCWGTSQFGTADRVYGPAAGLDGFGVPADLDEEGRRLYGRLVQVRWRPEQLLQFRGGLHHSPCMPPYLAASVAPWLMPGPPPAVGSPAPGSVD